jgi:hypothetical protein
MATRADVSCAGDDHVALFQAALEFCQQGMLALG